MRNTQFIERLVIFGDDNVDSLFSAKKIGDFLKSQKVNISSNKFRNILNIGIQNAIVGYKTNDIAKYLKT